MVIQPRNDRSIAHLISATLTRNGNIPNFALLVGSGASATSHVKLASEMVEEWRRLLYERSNSKDSYKVWLTKQYWHGSDDEYAILFEQMYDQPALRRAYIEECIKDAHPNWGYVYLTNLLKDNVFNVVFTTNFDDLVQEACYLYSDLRPIVCAHDSAVSGIRVASVRPKIIKLHGDYLFDDLKNTVRELETLEDNMKRKFMQFAQDYGLVVVGYSGRDRSVMDILDMLVKQDEYLKQGVYWCERPGETRGRRLSSLLRRDKVYTVEIPGFDEFMAELHNEAKLKLPEPVANPIWIAKERAKLFVDIPSPLVSHPVISRDIRKVLTAVSDVMSLRQPKARELLADRIPPTMRAAALKEKKQLEKALLELQKANEEDPEDLRVAYELASTLAEMGRKKELRDFVLSSTMPLYNQTYFLLRADDDETVISLGGAVPITTNDYSQISRINRAISLKRLGRIPEMQEELTAIERYSPSLYIQVGIAALRRNKPLMLAQLEKLLSEREITVDDIETFPVFEDYRQDPDLLKLIKSRRGIDNRNEKRYHDARRKKRGETEAKKI